MLADDGHPQVAAVLAAKFLRQAEAEMAGLVRALLRLPQQRLPLVARQAAVLEIGARPLAAVIEEALVVVLSLKRLDFRLDEAVKLGEIIDEILGQVEVHVRPP